MARDDDGDRIPPDGCSHGARCLGTADMPGYLYSSGSRRREEPPAPARLPFENQCRRNRTSGFVTADSYARTVRLGKRTGWIKVTHAPEKRGLVVEFPHTLAPADHSESRDDDRRPFR
jgi:hypothetical protein